MSGEFRVWLWLKWLGQLWQIAVLFLEICSKNAGLQESIYPWRKVLISDIYIHSSSEGLCCWWSTHCWQIVWDLCCFTSWMTNPVVCFFLFCLHRGNTFQMALGRIGEIRNIIPPGIHVMALTARATKKLHHPVSAAIGMWNPFVVAVAPCKRNLMYSVSTHVSIEETLLPLVDRLYKERTTMARTIIYCSSYDVYDNIHVF